MLYQVREWQRSLLKPLTNAAHHIAQIASNPLNPWAYTSAGQHVYAGFELLHRLGKEYEKPAFDIESVEVNGKTVAITERIAIAQPFCNLREFVRDVPADVAKNSPTVLVCAPLSGHHSTLLRDTVKTLLQDHNVFITDWVDARMVPLSQGAFGLNDYIHYIQNFIRQLGSKVHLLSVCQPTVPVLAAVSLMASKGEELPLSMTMMGGPIDTRHSPTEVNDLATERPLSWFQTNVIYTVPAKYPGYMRHVYPGFLQHAGFVAMNPGRHASSHWDYYLNLLKGDDEDTEAHRKFYDEYNAVLDLPAEFYLDTIQIVFQEHALPRGTWHVNGDRVAPEDIKGVGLLTIEGELDDISGPGQTKAALELCKGIPTSDKKHFEAEGAGHYGIFSGRRWRENVYPEVRSFIARFQEKSAATTSKAITVDAKPLAKAKVETKPAVKVIKKVVEKTVVAKVAPVTKTKQVAKVPSPAPKVATPATEKAKTAPVAKAVVAAKTVVAKAATPAKVTAKSPMKPAAATAATPVAKVSVSKADAPAKTAAKPAKSVKPVEAALPKSVTPTTVTAKVVQQETAKVDVPATVVSASPVVSNNKPAVKIDYAGIANVKKDTNATE